jgi:hypothetical protein
MNEQYEIQIQFLDGNSSIWASLVDGENNPIYLFTSYEEAEGCIEKLQIENYPKLCRIIKHDGVL